MRPGRVILCVRTEGGPVSLPTTILRGMKDWLPLVGVVFAQFVIIGLYLTKQRSDDKRRWDEKRLLAYSDFARLARALDKAATPLKWVQTKETDEREEIFSTFGAAQDEWTDSYFALQLLASNDVRGAAANVQTTLSKRIDWEEGLYRGSEVGSLGEWMQHHSEVRKSLTTFEDAVRLELRVTKPKRRYVVEADSLLTLAWRTLDTVLSVYGAPGHLIASKVRPAASPKDNVPK